MTEMKLLMETGLQWRDDGRELFCMLFDDITERYLVLLNFSDFLETLYFGDFRENKLSKPNIKSLGKVDYF